MHFGLPLHCAGGERSLVCILSSGSYLNISSCCVQEENLHDVMELLLALVFEDPHHIVVKMFEDLDGLK